MATRVRPAVSLALLIIGCDDAPTGKAASTAGGSGAPLPSAVGALNPAKPVGSADFGANWPLTASSGALKCIPVELRSGHKMEIAYIEVDGRSYALNGTAGQCVGASSGSGCAGLKLEKIDALRVDDPSIAKGGPRRTSGRSSDAARRLYADVVRPAR